MQMAHWWNNYPWRVIQPYFREIDTLDFDEERFLVELEEFSCNMVMLNAAGLIAGYDTELEDHTRSAYIDNFDLRHLVDRCHEKGIKVIARTDFSKIARPVFERHPDWVYRHADGTELDYNGYVQTCLCGGYQGGYTDLIVSDLNQAAVDDVVACGAKQATNKEIGETCDVVLTMLPNSPHVKAVMLGANGVAGYMKEGQVFIDMSSINPVASKEIAAELAKKGVEMLDAPVSGGEPKAIDGTLSFMVGGKQEILQWMHSHEGGQKDHSAIAQYYEFLTDIKIGR